MKKGILSRSDTVELMAKSSKSCSWWRSYFKRYGWKWGVPAYLVSGQVAWGRIYSKRHDIWDVLAGAAISVGSGFLFTTPFAKKHNVQLAPVVTSEGGCGVYFSMSLQKLFLYIQIDKNCKGFEQKSFFCVYSFQLNVQVVLKTESKLKCNEKRVF